MEMGACRYLAYFDVKRGVVIFFFLSFAGEGRVPATCCLILEKFPACVGVSKRGGREVDVAYFAGSNSTNIRSLKEQTDGRLDTERLFVSGVLSTLILCLFIHCIKSNNSCVNSILELFLNHQG